MFLDVHPFSLLYSDVATLPLYLLHRPRSLTDNTPLFNRWYLFSSLLVDIFFTHGSSVVLLTLTLPLIDDPSPPPLHVLLLSSPPPLLVGGFEHGRSGCTACDESSSTDPQRHWSEEKEDGGSCDVQRARAVGLPHRQGTHIHKHTAMMMMIIIIMTRMMMMMMMMMMMTIDFLLV